MRKFLEPILYAKTEPVKERIKVRVGFIFAWYDFWIGWFWDAKKKWLYILPIPCVGVVIKFGN